MDFNFLDPKYNTSWCDWEMCRCCKKEIPLLHKEVKQKIVEGINPKGNKFRWAKDRIETPCERTYEGKKISKKRKEGEFTVYDERYIIVDRSNRIDCEIEIKGKYKLDANGEKSPATRYVTYHLDCWRKEIS